MMAHGRATGNLVHDAHIAALVLEHGARELWTTDRDFARFPGLALRDPFIVGDG
jgi:predicted nucleic acid-binding protein